MLLLDEVADLEVLHQKVRILALAGVPSTAPSFHDAESEAGRFNFLSH